MIKQLPPYPRFANRPGPPPKDQEDVIRALKARKLWMRRPQGDWVQCRPRLRTKLNGARKIIELYMEREVEAVIAYEEQRAGYPNVAVMAA